MSNNNDAAPPTIRHMRSQLLSDAFPAFAQHSRTDSHESNIKPSSTTNLISSFRAASTPPERAKYRRNDSSGTRENSSATTDTHVSWSRTLLSKKKSQYYDEMFAQREPNLTMKSRTMKDSLITVEVKLNCCLESEQNFLIDIAFLLSEIYQRPTSCIMVLVNTNNCILLDSSSEPAYRITVTALSMEVAAMKNKRTAGLIQNFMLETINIPANRGVMLFHAIVEENLITNDLHVMEDISLTKQVTRKVNPRQKFLGNRKSSMARPTVSHRDVATTMRTKTASTLGLEDLVTIESSVGGTDYAKREIKRRKSFMALLGF